MIESGKALHNSASAFSEEMLDELRVRAEAGDARAHEVLLQLAESMLLDGAPGIPDLSFGRGPRTH